MASTVPTCLQETSLLEDRPAVCPLAGFSMEVSSKESASVLELAWSRCSVEIWPRHAGCQSISVINNGRIKYKVSKVFPE